MVHGIEEEEEKFFLGSVTSEIDAWTTIIDIMGKNITFKLDTGADVNAVSQTVFNCLSPNAQQSLLQKAERP